jgi:CelD/BcsL family acetyltransferase involved in cellulose biosynthesis
MIQRISTIEGFSALKAEWDRLYDASRLRNLFLTHEWLENWLLHFGEGEWVVLIKRQNPNSDIGGFALFKTNKKHFSFIGIEHSNFPGFLFPYGKKNFMHVVLDYLNREENCKSVAMMQQPDESSFENEVCDAAGASWIMIKKNKKVLRSIETPVDFEAYLSGRDKKVRHELKRKLNRLRNSGEMELRRFEECNEMDEFFHIIDDIEKGSWKFKSGTAIISSETESNFYKNIYKIYSKKSSALGFVLSQNQIPLSYVMGVVFEKTYYALKTSYKESHKQLSPGVVLFINVIKELASQKEKVNKIELLGDDARWKEDLATDRQELCTYHLFAKSLRNICYLAGRKCAKEILGRMGLEKR